MRQRRQACSVCGSAIEQRFKFRLEEILIVSEIRAKICGPGTPAFAVHVTSKSFYVNL